jgi:hypothetical protein
MAEKSLADGVRLFRVSLRLWWDIFPLFAGVAVLFAVGTIAAMVALSAALPILVAISGFRQWDLSGYILALPVVLGHAVFSIFACRVAARTLSGRAVQPLSVAGWIGSVFVLTTLAFCISILMTVVVDMPASMASIDVLTGLLACTPLLPRLALKAPETDGLRFIAMATLAALPWLIVIELLGWPMQVCTECWSFMQGGIITVPLLGLQLFLATTAAAVVSATVHVEAGKSPAAAR